MTSARPASGLKIRSMSAVTSFPVGSIDIATPPSTRWSLKPMNSEFRTTREVWRNASLQNRDGAPGDQTRSAYSISGCFLEAVLTLVGHPVPLLRTGGEQGSVGKVQHIEPVMKRRVIPIHGTPYRASVLAIVEAEHRLQRSMESFGHADVPGRYANLLSLATDADEPDLQRARCIDVAVVGRVRQLQSSPATNEASVKKCLDHLQLTQAAGYAATGHSG